ncbi:P-loop containing nucleoside triphosphate hydrolase protein [Podospora fimiseda]|uniref:DNA 3'-5' helicase n=1 Tax=Podospora fimiseda TaxID=252190 RepID=A0AAN7GPH1_9PEZI|nr:P-loop containing nucleoside triphosphate hydrolase protein [Podospora fimiseda]
MTFAQHFGRLRPLKLSTRSHILSNSHPFNATAQINYLSKRFRTCPSSPPSTRPFSQTSSSSKWGLFSNNDIPDDADEVILEQNEDGTWLISGPSDDHRTKTSSSDSKKKSHLAIAEELLQENFGHSSFRHEQAAAIETVLRGDNALVMFPTGAGKSLCYQIPAIAFPRLDEQDGSRTAQEAGITIVVSPLNSLIKDQIDSLKRRGIPAENIDSTKSSQEIRQVYASMAKSQLRLVYCGPERLVSPEFVDTLRQVPGGIRLLAVDEAHCVYEAIARFADEIEAERVICLTATATPRIAEDICNKFKINRGNIFRTSPYRPNLELRAQCIIRPLSDPDIENLETNKLHPEGTRKVTEHMSKLEALNKFLTMHPGPTIIYVATRSTAEHLASELESMDFDVKPYHAGLDNIFKQYVQDQFMASKLKIVCATVSLGMGLDKPNIRNVVHWQLAGTVEEYIQQIGRAGRDGKKSQCMFFLSSNSFYYREMFSRWNTPSLQSIKNLIVDIFSKAHRVKIGGMYKTSLFRQSTKFDIRLTAMSIIYTKLELEYGFLRATTNIYTSMKFKFTPCLGYSMVLKGNSNPVAKAILIGSTQEHNVLNINVAAVAEIHNVDAWDIIEHLVHLHEYGWIRLYSRNVVERYVILKKIPGPEDDAFINKIANEIYESFLEQEKIALTENRQVIDLITGDGCYSLALAKHLGSHLPDGKTKCGHCNYCLTGIPVEEPPRKLKETTPESIKEVLEATEIRDDPRFLARVAFGLVTPRIAAEYLAKHRVFGSMKDHNFEALLEEFTKVCETAGENENKQ